MNFQFSFILGVMFLAVTNCANSRHAAASTSDFGNAYDQDVQTHYGVPSDFVTVVGDASGIFAKLFKKIFSKVRIIGLGSEWYSK